MKSSSNNNEMLLSHLSDLVTLISTIYISFKVQNYSHSKYLLLVHDSGFEFLIIIGDLYISIFPFTNLRYTICY